ncbi:MAG: hypothetical protein GTO41_11810 [Burkholderiales bacterium]|nr:hypothetical protein [Burkholderiales bacterium]
MSSASVAAALDRIANALFQQDKTNRKLAAIQERAVVVSEKMLEMQQTNLAVTKALEQELTLRAASNNVPAN